MSILNELANTARKRVAASRLLVSDNDIKERAKDIARRTSDNDFCFERALASSDFGFICEVKKASPSKGIIADDFPYVEIATEYEKAGATAVSVLTEPSRFLGSDKYLEEIASAVSLPLLRKDFTVDVYQVYEAKVLGASAVLLICALLSENEISEYIGVCDSLGMSALIEAHDEAEVETAVAAGARVIGVNNRDLHTFNIDAERSARLRRRVPPGIIFVSESGVRVPEDVAAMKMAGADAALIGEALMRAADKAALLSAMRKAANEAGGGAVD